MPKPKSVKSLLELTAERIVEKFEIICYGCDIRLHNFKLLNETGEYENYVSPLVDLPSSLLDTLTYRLIDSRGLKPYIIRSVFLSNLTECRLLPVSGALPFTLQTISAKCLNLRVFELTCCKNIDLELINSVFKSCQHLNTVNLEGTNIGDECLAQMLNNNKTIQALNLARTKITDAGLDLLNQTCATRLSFLIILGTRVSVEGAAALLERLPNLLTLEYDSMLQVVRRVSSSGLMKLTVYNADFLDNDWMATSITGFRFLQALSLDYSDVGPIFLEALQHLPLLGKLELGTKTIQPYNLRETLMKIGGRLTHLSLENFSHCDFNEIGCLCMKLEVLRLSQCSFSTNNLVRANFPHLEQFFLFSAQDSHLPEKALKTVMAAQKLAVLYLQNVNISNSVVLESLEENLLKNLSALTLENCNRISLTGILKLLGSENQLSSLHLWSCHKISEFEKRLIQESIKCGHLDVNLQWQGETRRIVANVDNNLYRDMILPLLGVNVLPDL